MLMFVFCLWKNCKFDVVWYVYGTGSQPALNTFLECTVNLVLNQPFHVIRMDQVSHILLLGDICD